MRLGQRTVLYALVLTLAFAAVAWLALRTVLRVDSALESWLLTISVAGLAVILGSLHLWLIRRYVSERIQKVVQITGLAGGPETSQKRLDLGDDEFGVLAARMNHLIEQVEVARHQAIAARERLDFESSHDALTGTWNRGAALALLERERSRGERENSSLTVILFDLDNFKRINETYGYAAGDKVLQSVSSSISRTLRHFDVLSRYAGELFLVVAPNCNSRDAGKLAERIRMRLESTYTQVGEDQVRVTLSAGLAVGKSPATAEDLIALADSALYRAKENGRNCIAIEEANDESSRRVLFPSRAS